MSPMSSWPIRTATECSTATIFLAGPIRSIPAHDPLLERGIPQHDLGALDARQPEPIGGADLYRLQRYDQPMGCADECGHCRAHARATGHHQLHAPSLESGIPL